MVEALKEAVARYGKPEAMNTDQDLDASRCLQENSCRYWTGGAILPLFTERLWRSPKQKAVCPYELQDGFLAKRVTGRWTRFHNAERPSSAPEKRTPNDAGLELAQMTRAA